MTGRLVRAVLALLVGHASLFVIYWGLLNVPESNLGALAVSALAAVVLLVGVAAVEAHAVLTIGSDLGWRQRQRQAFLCVGAFVAALLIWLVFASAAYRLAGWHAAHRGEIDAWFIATFNATRTAWVHVAMTVAGHLVRDVVGLSLAVAALVAGTLGGMKDVLRVRWLRQGFGWRHLLIVAGCAGLLIWLPWQASTWRPASLPPTHLQPAFAAVKLALIALITHGGWALIMWSTIRQRQRRDPERAS